MANSNDIVIESSNANTYASASSTVITKPTGLAVGDVLLASIGANIASGSFTLTTPAGWTQIDTIGGNFGSGVFMRTDTFYKVADSGDVAASNFTFSASTTVNIGGVLMRVSGMRTSPIDVTDDANVENSANPSFTVSLTPTTDYQLYILSYMMRSTSGDFSAPVINGTNPTWTEQHDSGASNRHVVFTSLVDTTAAITSIDQTEANTAAGDDYFLILSTFQGNVSADDVLTLETSSPTAFAPVGSAGANTSLALTTNTNTAFAPTGNGTSPTVWTNESKPSTTWTNESKD